MAAYLLAVYLAALLFAAAGTAGQEQSSPYSWACAASASGTPSSRLEGCADSSCNPIQANLGGMMLVLATGSMLRTPGGAQPLGHTPGECCKLCKSTDMCNVWTFCNRKEGCGGPGSCTAYTNSLSPLASTSAMQGLMPAGGFGKFGAGCNAADGSWPYATCSLKQAADVRSPPSWGEGTAALGWVSGATPKPTNIKGCPAGLTDTSCRVCATTKNPQLCLSCMQGSTPWQAASALCVPCGNGGRC